MAGRLPTIMVSSTFYDLKEIRQQLSRMIEGDLGYAALISESSTFPVDPDVDTIENCRRRVEEAADILVLVVGNRYGSIDIRSGKSVTNLEYSAARAKGIPVYAFIDRQAQILFEAWRNASPDHKAAIAATVEDARLFEFIAQIRSDVWTNGFEYAGDITNSLRAQLAYLMASGLVAMKASKAHPDRDVLVTLLPKAYRLAVDQPKYWEYFLFAQVLDDEVKAESDRRREYDLRLQYGPTESIGDHDLFQWIQDRIQEVQILGENAAALVNESLPPAFGLPGQPGSVRDIVFVARQLAKVYSSAISWTQSVRRARTRANDFQKAIDELSNYAADVVEQIGAFGPYVQAELKNAIDDLQQNAVPAGTEPKKLDLSLRLAVVNPGAVPDAIREAMRTRGIEG